MLHLEIECKKIVELKKKINCEPKNDPILQTEAEQLRWSRCFCSQQNQSPKNTSELEKERKRIQLIFDKQKSLTEMKNNLYNIPAKMYAKI